MAGSSYGDDASISGSVVINDGSSSESDFRIESDGQTHMFFVDAGNDKVGIGTDAPDYTLDVAGNIGVDQYIYHNGDTNTYLNFLDDRFKVNVGGINYIDCDDSTTAPHNLTVNDGGNNVDFIVKGNGSNAGDPLFKTDASTGRVGINGVGSPEVELHVAGNIQTAGLHLDSDVITSTAALNANKAYSKIFNSGSATVGGVLPNPSYDGQIRVIVGMQGSSGANTVAYTNLAGTTTTKTLTNGAGVLLISVDIDGAGTYRWCAVGDVS